MSDSDWRQERLLPGDGYTLEKTPFGQRLRIEFPETPAEPPAYDGPFAVRIDAARRVRVMTRDTLNGRYIPNYAALGQTLVEAPGALLNVSESGFVVLKVEFSANYVFNYFMSATMPAQATDRAYVPIAYVRWNAAARRIQSVEQLQYGCLIQLNRAF